VGLPALSAGEGVLQLRHSSHSCSLRALWVGDNTNRVKSQYVGGKILL